MAISATKLAELAELDQRILAFLRRPVRPRRCVDIVFHVTSGKRRPLVARRLKELRDQGLVTYCVHTREWSLKKP